MFTYYGARAFRLVAFLFLFLLRGRNALRNRTRDDVCFCRPIRGGYFSGRDDPVVPLRFTTC